MSIQSLYFSPFSSLAAQSLRVGSRLDSGSIGGVDSQKPVEGTSKVGKKKDKEQDEKKSAGLKSGDILSESGDILSLSSTPKKTSDAESAKRKSADSSREADKTSESRLEKKPFSSEEELTDKEKQQVTELQSRDTEVRAHEAAHLAAAGAYATSGASYTFETGPDGKKYAVGGEVSIDASPIDGDPEATIQKAQQVQAAALAPAQPSSQDYKVAAKASQMEAEARQELQQQRSEELKADQSGTSEENSGVQDQKHGRAASVREQSVSSKYLSQTLAAASSRNTSRFHAVA
ncbi:MAG: hypothetical protein LBQ54_15055 [Planctomycetaceae bacterium]|jgi:hypothetical protein|nr:hypothetical protein [Planctomycetaceae bacterium]